MRRRVVCPRSHPASLIFSQGNFCSPAVIGSWPPHARRQPPGQHPRFRIPYSYPVSDAATRRPERDIPHARAYPGASGRPVRGRRVARRRRHRGGPAAPREGGGIGGIAARGGDVRNAGNRRLIGGAFNRPAPHRNRCHGNSLIGAVIRDSRYGAAGNRLRSGSGHRGMPVSRRPRISAKPAGRPADDLDWQLGIGLAGPARLTGREFPAPGRLTGPQPARWPPGPPRRPARWPPGPPRPGCGTAPAGSRSGSCAPRSPGRPCPR